LVSPVTVIGLAVPVWVMPPGLEVTAKEVMGLPPSEAGALKLMVAWALPAVAVTPVGAPGTVGAGVTLFEGADTGPVPTPLVAVTVKV